MCESFDAQRHRLVSDLHEGEPITLICVDAGFDRAIVLIGSRRAATFRCRDFDFLDRSDNDWVPFFGTLEAVS